MAGDEGDKKSSKPRMGMFLRQSFGDKSATSGKDDLQALKLRYQGMCKKLKTVQKALKDRHAALLSTAKARVSVAQTVSCMTKETPLEKIAGKTSDEGNKKEPGEETYASVMMDDLDRHTRKMADDFHKFAIDYVAEWEKTVTTRVNADMKKTDALRRDADHYKAKVDSLQSHVKKLEDHHKDVPEATSEKLERNEKKLSDANRLYNDAEHDLFVLLEEVVDRSWRDLHPLLLKTFEMEIAICHEEEKIMAQPFQRLMDDMIRLAEEEQVKPRLKDVVDGTPEAISSRSNNVDETTKEVQEQAPPREPTREEPSGNDSDLD